MNTILQGVFIDRVEDRGAKVGDRTLFGMAMNLWTGSMLVPNRGMCNENSGLMALRAARPAGAPSGTLQEWRTALSLWTDFQDRNRRERRLLQCGLPGIGEAAEVLTLKIGASAY